MWRKTGLAKELLFEQSKKQESPHNYGLSLCDLITYTHHKAA
jgi:hypothetical protein